MRKSFLLVAILAACKQPAREPVPEPPKEEPAKPTPIVAREPNPPPAEEPPARPQEPAPISLGKYDPPANLGHLETTPPEERKQIDELVAVMFDPQAGRDSLEAKVRLVAIGKPAFPRVLGKMAEVRDTITDNDTIEERLAESSLRLADECLREMDGYLDAHDKQVIRPGTGRRYIQYVVRLHYRRWTDGMGSQPLKDRNEMPGPFDPAKAQPSGN